jgi:F-type H+-transporting ATPase subunit b
MRQKRQILVILASLPLFVVAAAAEGSRPSALTDFLGKSLNFLILFGGLAVLLAKPIRAFLEARIADIRKTIADAAASREDAEEKLESMRKRLSGLAEEAGRIRTVGEAEGQKDKLRILGLAAREAEKIRAMSREEIEARGQAARRELRRFAAELAVSLARTRIERRLTPELHTRLIDESITTLGKRHEEPDSG